MEEGRREQKEERQEVGRGRKEGGEEEGRREGRGTEEGRRHSRPYPAWKTRTGSDTLCPPASGGTIINKQGKRNGYLLYTRI